MARSLLYNPTINENTTLGYVLLFFVITRTALAGMSCSSPHYQRKDHWRGSSPLYLSVIIIIIIKQDIFLTLQPSTHDTEFKE